MRFNVSSSSLLKALSDASKAIPTKTTNSILENFLFSLEGDKLKITASDQELTLRTVVAISNEESSNSSLVIPSKYIIDLLKEIPDQPIIIARNDDEPVSIIWSSGESKMSSIPAEDYPDIKELNDGCTKVEFSASDLFEGISSTIYAASDDDKRPAMTGILFDFSANSTSLVGTDAHKLICYTTKEVKTSEDCSFILHKKPASILRAILDKDVEKVQVAFDSKGIIFSFNDTTIICRQIEGRFPDYRAVIPQNNPNVLLVDRQMFLNAVKRVAVCSNKSTNLMKFSLQPNRMEIAAQDTGLSIAAQEQLACKYDGEDLQIGFKSTFLSEILSNLGSKEVEMKFLDSKRAALILPDESDEQRGKVCCILMPNTFA